MPKDKNSNYSVDLHIRLTPKEREILEREANRIGCNLSQMARRIILRKNNIPQSVTSEPELNRRLLLASNSLKTEFKKLSSRYCEFVGIFIKRMSSGDAISFEGAEYSIGALERITLRLQDTINTYLSLHGVDPVDEVKSALDSRNDPATVSDDVAGLANLILDIINHNMQNITILGTVSGEVSTFKDENGNELMRFVVSVSSIREPGKMTEYVVVREGGILSSYLHDGRQVVVVGDLDYRPANGEMVVFAHDVKLTR